MIFLFKSILTFKILFYMMYHVAIYYSILLVNKSKLGPWLEQKVSLWAHYCIRLLGNGIECEGSNNLDKIAWNRHVFFVANHQSYYDIPSLLSCSEKMLGFVAKYELGRIPFLNYWMKKIGCVFINRKKFTTAIRKLKALEKRGRPAHLVCFPEGTRSKNGSLSPFKTGVLKMAWQLDSVLLPSLIVGTRQAWEGRKSLKPGTPIRVRFLEPIDLKEVKKEKKFDAFFKEFEETFNTEYSSLSK